MKKYNKSEIMKRAWGYYKTGKCNTFGESLRISWMKAKRFPEEVTISELNVGDTITYEYGDYGNFVKGVVTGIGEELFLGELIQVKVVSLDGKIDLSFSDLPSEGITRLDVAEMELEMAA